MMRELIWYLSRPDYYGEFVRVCFGVFSDFFLAEKRWKERALAQGWCKEKVVQKNIFFSDFENKIGKKVGFLSFSKIFPEQLTEAEMRVRQSGAKMGGGSSLDLLYSLTEGIDAEKIIETGVAYGWSSLVFVTSLNRRGKGKLWSIDKPYPGSKAESFVGCAVAPENCERWSLLRGPDRRLLQRALREAGVIDLCHYDSDKSYSGRMLAYPQLWSALRSGGVFISDDIGDNLAFKNFCEKIGEKPWIIEEGEGRYLGVLVKK